MDRLPPARATTRTVAQHEDAHDLRAAIAAAMAVAPPDPQRLREAVWTYVRAERAVGVPPAVVILALTDVVQRAGSWSPADALERTRQVILWCVEAYFGRLGGEPMSPERPATAAASTADATGTTADDGADAAEEAAR